MRNRTEDGETTTNLVPIETFAFLNTYTRSKLCINKYKRLHDQYRSQLFFPYLMSVGDANILHVTSEISRTSEILGLGHAQPLPAKSRVLSCTILFEEFCATPIFMIIHATAASGISTEDFKMALKEIFSSSNLLHRDDLFLEEDFSSCIARREGWIPDGKVENTYEGLSAERHGTFEERSQDNYDGILAL
ncbi:hypothetical protein RRG08_028030 [Elysia crispata]|uniref:Uncharacterized protein n=1 Tax=Elysia crispata TaxID=231223 RepID=A0AAE1BC45_9GAST|nr:hypothetical protein RRG08_028030 [Elysia crispata]